MAQNVKIITTTVPNGIRTEGAKHILNFSVFLSPRLPDTGRLKDYFEILEWSRFTQEIRKQIEPDANNLLQCSFYNKRDKEINGEPHISVSNEITLDDASKPKIRLIKNNYLAAEHEWKSVFPETNHISGWIINDAKYKISSSVTVQEIEAAINKSFKDGIDKLKEKIKDIEDKQTEESVQFYYAQIQNLHLLNTKILKDKNILLTNMHDSTKPGQDFYKKHFSPFTLEMYAEIKADIEAAIGSILEKFNDRILALKADEEVRVMNQANGEFHKKLSIMGKFPDLLRRYGWLWDFEMEFENGLPKELKDANNENVKSVFVEFKGFQNLKTKAKADSTGIDKELFNEYKDKYKILDATGKVIHNVIISDDYFTGSFGKALEEVDFLNSYTYCAISNNTFTYAHEARINEKEVPGKKPFVKNGYLNAELLSASLINTAQLLEKIANERRNPKEIDSSGISLRIKGLDKIIGTINDNQPSQKGETPKKADTPNGQGQPAPGGENQKDDIGAEGYLIFGNHLDEGYRVDVLGFKGDRTAPQNCSFGTLTAREATYSLNTRSNENDYIYKSISEGWITESAQNGNQPDTLLVDEELFRWSGGSLVCPMPGKYDEASAESTSKENASELCNEIIVKAVVPKSDRSEQDFNKLIPLRFGKKYTFRMRVADICGNGMLKEEKIEDVKKQITDKNIWSEPIEYKRTIRVSTPSVFFTETPKKHKLFGKKELRTDFKGKELNTLVIKSVEMDGKLKCISAVGESRCIAPSRVNLNFINYHGTFDGLYKLALKAPTTPNKGDLPEDKKLARLTENEKLELLRTKIIELESFKDSVTVKDKVELLGKKEIPRGVVHNNNVEFLHDPMVTGYKVLHLDSGTFNTLDFPKKDYFEKSKESFFGNLAQKYTKITLIEGPDFKINISANNSVEICLKQGQEIKAEDPNSDNVNNQILIYSRIDDLNKPYFNEYDPQHPETGLEENLSYPLKFNVVHAVQKPCLINSNYKEDINFLNNIKAKEAWLNDRKVASTSAQINFHFEKFPCLTSESMSLHVSYDDFVGNKSNIAGFDNLKIEKVIKKDITPASQEEQIFFDQGQFEHFFGDTKHRWVSYRVETISKFKQYFNDEKSRPENIGNQFFFSVFGEIDHVDTVLKPKLKTESINTVKLNIISTAKPDGLIINSITPLLRWEISENAETKTVNRICDTFRVFFDNDWFSSGEDEKIAVLFDENLHTVSDYTEKIISQFGLDPITKVDLNTRFKITPDLFHDGKNKTVEVMRDQIVPNPVFKDAKPGDIIKLPTKPNEKPAEEQIVEEDILTTEKISAIVFDVAFSEDKRKWYADIKLNNEHQLIKDNYMPFIKFAICRYQEHSVHNNIVDCRFSSVSLTDFSQILPCRTIEIKDGKTIKYSYGEQYIKSAKRKPNELHVYSDATPLVDLDIEKPTEIENYKPLDGKEISFNLGNKYRIEEYEYYELPESEKEFDVNQTIEPRNNYTKRLVFHYNQ